MPRRSADPLVSVIVPAFNAELTLKETLVSVARQTYAKLDILIVDDGSTDGTATVARDFCASEKRARLMTQANAGVAAARNRAISEAAGDWVAPVDADDLWHETKIEKQLAAARVAPAPPGLVYCWHRLIDGASCVTGSGPAWALFGPAFHQLAYSNVVENGSALLLRRDALVEVGGYDSSLHARDAQGCEDVLVQLEIARRHPVACVPEYLVGHRRHAANMSSGFDRMVRSWRLVYDRISREEPDLPPKLLRWVDGKCAFDIAEQSAAAGNRAAAMRSLAQALRRDPHRSGALLAYRLLRSVRRRFRGRAHPPQRPNFFAVNSTESLAGDPYELPRAKALVDCINRRRLAQFSLLDQGRA